MSTMQQSPTRQHSINYTPISITIPIPIPIDFNGISVIGLLCDDGQIIRCDIITQKQGKIFVRFNVAGGHYWGKYDWIVVPNKRTCYPLMSEIEFKNQRRRQY
eukprot:109876_1